MQVGTNILNGIKNAAIKLSQINVGDLAGRAVILIQANPIPVAVAAIVIIAAVIFVAYKYLSAKEEVPHFPKIEITFEKNPENNAKKPSDISKKSKIRRNNPNLGVAQQPTIVKPPVQATISKQKNAELEIVQTKIEGPTNLLSPSSLGNSLIASGFLEKVDQSTLQVLKESFIANEMSSETLCKSISNLGLNKNSALDIGLESTTEYLSDPLGFFSKEFTDRVSLQLNNISKVTKQFQKNGCRIATAANSLLTGLANLFSGNPLGFVSLGLAIREFYNMHQMETDSNLEAIFKNIDSDFKVIGKLGKQSKQTLFGIKEQIEITQLKLKNIEDVFGKINQIITDGDESLKIYQIEINQLKSDVEYFRTSSADNFKLSRKNALKAEKYFDKCLLNIQKLAKCGDFNQDDSNESEVKFKAFMELASGLATIFTTGMNHFRTSQIYLNVGLTDFNELEKINFQLNCKEELLIKLSKATNEKILELTNNKLLKEANENLEIANGRLDEALRLRLEEDETIKGLKENIDKVHDEVSSWIDRNMLLGACGAVLGAPFGAVPAGVLALVCPKAVNAATEIFTPKTDLKTNFADPENVGDVTMGFYTESTGCFYLFKGASKTAGEVKIHNGTEVKIYKFNLNEDHFGLNFDQITADLKDFTIDEQSKTIDTINDLLKQQATK